MSRDADAPRVHDHRTIYHRRMTDWFNFYPISCTHLGHICADEALLRNDVKRLANDPNGIGLLMGDLCDAVAYTDKRFDADSVAPWVRAASNSQELVDLQVDYTADIFAPVADKLVGVLMGNHEETIRRRCNTNISRRVAQRLTAMTGHTVPYLGLEAYIRLRFSRGCAKNVGSRSAETFTVYAHHGWFAGPRKSGSLTNNLENLYSISDAQLSVVGHGHKKHACPPQQFIHIAPRGQATVNVRYAVMTGAYLRQTAGTVESYAVSKGYRATLLGYTHVSFCPTTGQVKVEI